MGNLPCHPSKAGQDEPVRRWQRRWQRPRRGGTSWRGRVVNKVLRPWGMGAFHCGVELYGVEWSYGVNQAEKESAIFSCVPRKCYGQQFYKQVPMGLTTCMMTEVLDIIEYCQFDWQSADYHLIKHNCCHFASAFCKMLGVEEVPPWVMSLTRESSKCIEPQFCRRRDPKLDEDVFVIEEIVV